MVNSWKSPIFILFILFYYFSLHNPKNIFKVKFFSEYKLTGYEISSILLPILVRDHMRFGGASKPLQFPVKNGTNNNPEIQPKALLFQILQIYPDLIGEDHFVVVGNRVFL